MTKPRNLRDRKRNVVVSHSRQTRVCFSSVLYLQRPAPDPVCSQTQITTAAGFADCALPAEPCDVVRCTACACIANSTCGRSWRCCCESGGWPTAAALIDCREATAWYATIAHATWHDYAACGREPILRLLRAGRIFCASFSEHEFARPCLASIESSTRRSLYWHLQRTGSAFQQGSFGLRCTSGQGRSARHRR